MGQSIAWGFVWHKGSYLRDGYNVIDFAVAFVSVANLVLLGADVGFLRYFTALGNACAHMTLYSLTELFGWCVASDRFVLFLGTKACALWSIASSIPLKPWPM